jgi:hypothetical protein
MGRLVTITGTYNPYLVTLSVLVACFASLFSKASFSGRMSALGRNTTSPSFLVMSAFATSRFFKHWLPAHCPLAYSARMQRAERYRRLVPMFLAGGFALVVLAAVGAILLAREASRGQDSVSHTLEVRTQALLMQSELESAESSQRGYILTNNEAFLSSFTATLVSIRKTFDALGSLTADNSMQQQRLSSLFPIIDSKIDELQSTITLNRSGHRAIAKSW